jgi:hypothetical protein
MPQPLSRQQPSDWRASANLRQAKVVVCTTTATFAGYTYRLHQQRLSDALNKGFTADSSHIGREFLPLIDVEIFLPDGRKEHMTSTYVRKVNILFVGEKSGGQPVMSDLKDKLGMYPLRTTKPIGAEVYMPAYTLVGKMHGEMWHQLLDALNRDETFLPLTNVEISPEPATGESTFDFVAVNKDRVIYVGESPKTP